MNSLLQTFWLAIVLVLSLPSCSDKHLSSQEEVETVNKEWIGTNYYRWTDTSRPDELYEKGAYRDVLAQIWYPISSEANPNLQEMAPYFPFLPEVKPHLESWDQADFDLVNGIKTRGLLGTQIAHQTKKYPLIVLSPALGSHSSYYTQYAEQLVDEGYVVLGVNSKYESEYVINEAGHVTTSNHQYHDSLKSLKIPEQISADEYREARSNRLIVIAEDLIFAINELEKLNEGVYKGLLDVDNIGILGHSIGGCAAIDAARMDSRIKACVNLDGTPSTQALAEGMDQAFMFIEDLTDYRNHRGYKMQFDRREAFCKKVKAEAFRVLIGKTNHSSFYSSNIRFAESAAEKQEAERPVRISYTYLSAFFSRYLKNKPKNISPIISDSLEVFVFPK